MDKETKRAKNTLENVAAVVRFLENADEVLEGADEAERQRTDRATGKPNGALLRTPTDGGGVRGEPRRGQTRGPLRRRGRPQGSLDQAKRQKRSIRPTEGHLWHEGNAHHEAEGVLAMVRRGLETLTSARALIGVSPRIRRVLTHAGYSRSVAFRDEVSREFEALVLRSGKPAP